MLTVLLAAAGAQEKAPDAAEFARRAVEAYKARQYGAYLENIRRANELRPHHPRLMYNLASALALNGKPAEAVAMLGRVAAMGLVYPAAKDDDFAAIRQTVPFRAVLDRFAANAAPVHRGEVALTVPLRGLIMEGVAFDPVEKAFYASSVRERRIVRVGASGEVKDFAAGRDDLWSALGIRVDARRRLLWVATAAMAQTRGLDPKDVGRSALLAFDLASGKLARSYQLSGAPNGHALGDLAIGPDGSVFATDSRTPAL
jgi:hypothetical protein